MISVVIMSLSLLMLAVFLLATDNLLRIIGHAEQEMEVYVYLEDRVDDEGALSMHRQLLSMDEVASVVFVSREEALDELLSPAYTDLTELAEDRAFVCKKLGLTEADFDELLSAPARDYDDYPSNEWLFELKNRFKLSLHRLGFGAARK